MIVAKATMMQQNEKLLECEMVKEQLNMLKDFKSSFISGYDGDDGEKEYDVTVKDCLHQLPIMKKRHAENGTAVSVGISVCTNSIDLSNTNIINLGKLI
jgi:hypothetical protein